MEAVQGRTELGNEWIIINAATEIGRFFAPSAVDTPAAALAMWPSIAAEIDAPPPVTPADVDRERDRRVGAGFAFGGHLYQSRPDDRENIAGASTAALAAIVNGAQAGDLRWHGGDSDFAWIAADNALVPMDAQTMFAFGQAAMAHKQAMIFAARALKDMAEIPPDVSSDTYWP